MKSPRRTHKTSRPRLSNVAIISFIWANETARRLQIPTGEYLLKKAKIVRVRERPDEHICVKSNYDKIPSDGKCLCLLVETSK